MTMATAVAGRVATGNKQRDVCGIKHRGASCDSRASGDSGDSSQRRHSAHGLDQTDSVKTKTASFKTLITLRKVRSLQLALQAVIR